MQIQYLTLHQINWIMIGLYGIFCLAQLVFSDWNAMDAAGRGMAAGFLMIYFIYVLLLAGLNLIRVKWVRVFVLILCCLPIAMFLS